MIPLSIVNIEAIFIGAVLSHSVSQSVLEVNRGEKIHIFLQTFSLLTNAAHETHPVGSQLVPPAIQVMKPSDVTSTYHL